MFPSSAVVTWGGGQTEAGARVNKCETCKPCVKPICAVNQNCAFYSDLSSRTGDPARRSEVISYLGNFNFSLTLHRQVF